MPRRLSLKKVDAFFERLQQAMPDPKGELYYTNAYTLLVAVTLSAQATDIGVNKATSGDAGLFAVADTPEKMLALGEETLKHYIKTIGLFNSKAKHIMAAAKMLVETYQSTVPDNRADLEKLPGVGRKTANVVLNIWFQQPTIAVDTHLFRTSNRSGLAAGKTPLQIEQQLEKRIPAKYLLHAHHWLILHGRYTCMARKPACQKCIVSDICLYDKKIKTVV